MTRLQQLDDRHQKVLMVTLLAVVTGLSLWAGIPVWGTDPSRSLSLLLLGPMLGLTGLLLLHQAGQRRNAWWLIGAALATSLHRAIGHSFLGLSATVSFIMVAYATVLTATVLLRYPSDNSPRSTHRFCRLTATAALVLFGAIVVTSHLEWRGYGHLPWPTSGPDPRTGPVLESVRQVWWSCTALYFVVLFSRHWRRISRLERRILAPIVWTTALAVIGFAGLFATRWLTPFAVEVLEALRTFGGPAVALAFFASAIRLRLAQSDVALLAARLAAQPTVAEVEAGLRNALSDDQLSVLYWLPDQEAYVDSAGVPTPEPAPDEDRLVVRVASHDGTPLALVVGDASLRRYQRLVDVALGVSHLALENARLEAGLRAQIVAVHEAHTRLLHSALAQRRHLERDLHDGAQQRLLAVGMRLGAIEAVAPDTTTADQVQLARKELHLALDELRDLAHGIFPAVLTQSGLGPALESVAERMPVPVEISVPAERWDIDVESAAYLVACEALTNAAKHAGSCTVGVEVTADDGKLLVVVADDGDGSELLAAEGCLDHLRDRVETMGGTFSVSSRPEHGTRIEAMIPCG